MMNIGLRIFCAALLCAACLGIASCSSLPPNSADPKLDAESPRHRTCLDGDWLFLHGDTASSNEVVSAGFDDHQWQRVQIPHDYVLDGGYSSTNDRHHGYLQYDVGWYRKRFSIPESARGRILRLDFDGVFRDSEVWLNGHYLGRHPSGYTPFSYDITSLANTGGENLLAVRVDPREWEGWWYEGGGIYRHVYLTSLAPLHVAQWGTYIVSKLTNDSAANIAEAEVTIQTTLENAVSAASPCQLVSEIIAPDGSSLKTLKSAVTVEAGQTNNASQVTKLAHPQLWSLESPRLYQLRTTILQAGKPVDSTISTFGIRTIRYDPDKGFFLNGQRVELRATANHQDFAGLGIAVPDSLQPWRVKQLKRMGCNAWRTAHNPPSEALLDACDRLGMMVMDENRHLGDAYTHHSPPGTGSTNLADLATMIRRDRNHPSIIMWSMCNEEGLQGTREGASIFSAMMDTVRRYDQTRPITCAMNAGWLTNGIADVEDIIGVNYNINRYDAIHKRHPNKLIFGSEDTNEKTTRGEYVDDPPSGMRSAYNLSVQGWLAVVNRPWMAGSFTWTGFDYRGEPNPYGWPDVSNNTGLLDLCGFPKDKCYYFESCWSDKPMVHLLPDSWNWPGKEGQNIRVIAFSNAREVDLLLNGQSLGTKTVPHDSFAEWQVPYQPGQLLAKAIANGKTVATALLETTGEPSRLQLSPDTTVLQPGEAIVVPVSVLDDKGRVVPFAHNRLHFQLTGGGRILGVGNGNPADHDPNKADQRNAFHGLCMAVIQAGSNPSQLELKVTADKLNSTSVKFQVRN